MQFLARKHSLSEQKRYFVWFRRRDDWETKDRQRQHEEGVRKERRKERCTVRWDGGDLTERRMRAGGDNFEEKERGRDIAE